MSYTNGESAKLLTNANNFSQRRRIGGRSQSNRSSALIKDLASDTINCALAHWYFLPGLELQRYRLRLAFSLIRTPDSARREFSMLPATLYLDSDFALKSLRAQSRIGSYLDVSSPWVFPFYVLRMFKPDRAMLLNTSSTRNVFRHLAKQTERNGTKVQTKDLGYLSGLSESFDTITCLARLSTEDKERELLRNLWQALNPGGTLILSVACTSDENRTDKDRRSPGSAASAYDSKLFQESCIGSPGRTARLHYLWRGQRRDFHRCYFYNARPTNNLEMARVSRCREILAPLFEYFTGARSGNSGDEVYQIRQSLRCKPSILARSVS